MDRRTTGVILGALLMGACTCGESFDLPEAPPTEPAPPVASGDPRVPSGFDLTWPEDATVRYGEASLERATVLVTTEAEPAAVLRFAREQLEGRGWSVRARAGEAPAGVGVFREAIEAFEGDEPRASAIVERGAAPVTRLHLSRSSSRAVAFHAPDEPREWRAVRRAPLPAPPGPTEPACNQALMRMCEALQAAGGPDALDCALDRRAACVRSSSPSRRCASPRTPARGWPRR